MKLRDQIAIAAMQGAMTDDLLDKERAELAYKQADAMLIERDKAHGRLRSIKLLAENMVNKPDSCSIVKSGDLILAFLDSYGL